MEGNSIDKTGTGWHSANGGNGFESEDNRSTLTWITIPQYGEISVKLSQMEGTFVRIDSVTVERTEEEDQIALPVFKSPFGGSCIIQITQERTGNRNEI